MTNKPASAAAPPTETFAGAIARINALSPGSLLTSYQKDAASPVGWVQVEIAPTSAECTDGISDRLSGYGKQAEQIIVDLDAPPRSATLRAADRVVRARDIAAARRRLLDWLAATGFGANMAALINAGAHRSST